MAKNPQVQSIKKDKGVIYWDVVPGAVQYVSDIQDEDGKQIWRVFMSREPFIDLEKAPRVDPDTQVPVGTYTIRIVAAADPNNHADDSDQAEFEFNITDEDSRRLGGKPPAPKPSPSPKNQPPPKPDISPEGMAGRMLDVELGLGRIEGSVRDGIRHLEGNIEGAIDRKLGEKTAHFVTKRHLDDSLHASETRIVAQLRPSAPITGTQGPVPTPPQEIRVVRGDGQYTGVHALGMVVLAILGIMALLVIIGGFIWLCHYNQTKSAELQDTANHKIVAQSIDRLNALHDAKEDSNDKLVLKLAELAMRPEKPAPSITQITIVTNVVNQTVTFQQPAGIPLVWDQPRFEDRPVARMPIIEQPEQVPVVYQRVVRQQAPCIADMWSLSQSGYCAPRSGGGSYGGGGRASVILRLPQLPPPPGLAQLRNSVSKSSGGGGGGNGGHRSRG